MLEATSLVTGHTVVYALSRFPQLSLGHPWSGNQAAMGTPKVILELSRTWIHEKQVTSFLKNQTEL